MILLGCVLLAAVSLVVVLVRMPEGLVRSADPGAPVIPHWVNIGPPLIGVALVLLLPRRHMPQPVVTVRRDRLAITLGALLAILAAHQILSNVAAMSDEVAILTKAVALMVVPTVLLMLFRDAIRIDRKAGAWRWWAPAVVIAVWILLSQVAPWNPRQDFSDYDQEFLIIAAVAVAITAGVGEELFFRRWLQSRLETAIGPWPGIALGSLLFALVHLGSHGSGDIVLDVATVVVSQGSFGLFMGVLWWRYRNLTAIIVAHIIVNGGGVVAYLLTSG